MNVHGHRHTHIHRKLSVSLNVFGLEDPTVCVTLYIYSVRLCRWDCVLPVGVVQLHCSETHTTDQTRWKNEETSPSFNLHYTVHSIRSALWGGHPQRTQLKCACMCERACECAFNQKLLPAFFFCTCGASVAMVMVSWLGQGRISLSVVYCALRKR